MVGHAEIEVKVHKLAHRVPLAWSDSSHGERQQPTFYSPPFTIPGHSGPQLRTQGAQQRADRVSVLNRGRMGSEKEIFNMIV